MHIYPECYACISHLAKAAMDIAEVDDATQVAHLRQVLVIASQHDPDTPPPSMAREVFDFLQSAMNEKDLYRQIKIESNQLAMGFYLRLKRLVRQGEDQFLQALKIAGTGNIIDVAHSEKYDLWEEVVRQVSQPILGDSVAEFKQQLAAHDSLLYLADNAGETVFDRVLIEEINIPVVYAVKGGPAMNDATLEDALAAGIDQVAEIVETGSRTPGTYLEDCSPAFRERFNQAGLVLSKGQANYETLDGQGEKMYFLLRIKCPIVARSIGYPVGRLVLKQG